MRVQKPENTNPTKSFRTKKSLGQHFLNNPRIPRLMADAADVTAGDVVLEVGPGTGILTKELLGRGATVLALEADHRAVAVLNDTFKDEISRKQLIIVHSDVRELDLATLAPTIKPHAYKVVANIPYYLSGLLFRTFLESGVQPSDLVFLVQREVAERIARDTKESLLSLSVKVFGEPTYVKTVPRGNFTPPPKVDSAIIAVRNIATTRLSNVREADFFTLIHAGFASKRKQLLGNLSQKYPRDVLMHTFSTLGIRIDVRGEDVPLPMWLSLVRALSLHTQSTKN